MNCSTRLCEVELRLAGFVERSVVADARGLGRPRRRKAPGINRASRARCSLHKIDLPISFRVRRLLRGSSTAVEFATRTNWNHSEPEPRVRLPPASNNKPSPSLANTLWKKKPIPPWAPRGPRCRRVRERRESNAACHFRFGFFDFAFAARSFFWPATRTARVDFGFGLAPFFVGALTAS